MSKSRPKIIVHNHFKTRDVGVGLPAYQAGVEAAAKGSKQGENPHWPGSVEYEAWRRGFINRHEENVRATGRQFGQRVGGREAKLISGLLRGRDKGSRDTWYHHKQVNGYYILRGAVGDEGRWLVRNGRYDIVKTANSQAEAESFAKRQPNGGAQQQQIAADATYRSLEQLARAGFKKTSTGSLGWTEYWENEKTGETYRIEYGPQPGQIQSIMRV